MNEVDYEAFVSKYYSDLISQLYFLRSFWKPGSKQYNDITQQINDLKFYFSIL